MQYPAVPLLAQIGFASGAQSSLLKHTLPNSCSSAEQPPVATQTPPVQAKPEGQSALDAQALLHTLPAPEVALMHRAGWPCAPSQSGSTAHGAHACLGALPAGTQTCSSQVPPAGHLDRSDDVHS